MNLTYLYKIQKYKQTSKLKVIQYKILGNMSLWTIGNSTGPVVWDCKKYTFKKNELTFFLKINGITHTMSKINIIIFPSEEIAQKALNLMYLHIIKNRKEKTKKPKAPVMELSGPTFVPMPYLDWDF